MATSNKPVSIVIIDDHRLFNDGLCSMLRAEGIEVMAQVYDSREAEQTILTTVPDVVLADFNMPHLNGIELTKRLIAQQKDIKVLILSMYNEDMYVESFRQSGARGYIFKTASVGEVISAIQKLHSGETFFPQTNKKNVHTDDLFLKKLKLSSHELEIIRLVKSGLKTKEIADQLHISFYTAETHRKNIKLKIGVEGEAAFLKFVYEVDLE
jgi:two-component system nitrate/nitrite response regulator NarL